MNFLLPCFTSKTSMKAMIEIFIEGHFVLPASEQVICVFYEGAFANEALRNGRASF
jgi:hypothetical protein